MDNYHDRIDSVLDSETAKRNSFESIAVEFKNGALCEPESIDWLWPGWIAKRKLHILAGEPGTNKTTLAITLASIMTTGKQWPDKTCFSKPQNVVVWSSEDDFNDTILPRFIANGGDRTKLYFIHGVNQRGTRRAFNPKKDLELLNKQIAEIGNVGMVIIDSIADCAKGDSNNNSDTRTSLQPLVDAATRFNFAALGVAHFNKGNESSNPLNRIVGSVAFGGMARIVYACAIDPDESVSQRLFVRVKSNIGKNHDGFRFAVKVAPIPGYPHIESASIEWMDELHGTAKELLGLDTETSEGKKGKTPEAVNTAKEFLTKTLSGVDMMRQDEVSRLAEENGISKRTLERAKEELKVISLKGKNIWYWKLNKEGGEE